ncbi:hypothetical protein OH76DRAFT_1244898 [Lentinus brumalis]|uniref:Uncharacterized protein n=1 Tax=Lentinus brumalis TaxID=2498619 RepID=A0A371CS19_9APHY|nr:hypothetical protein OH76DRAFT_1244898 [Polyporus brumalis]
MSRRERDVAAQPKAARPCGCFAFRDYFGNRDTRRSTNSARGEAVAYTNKYEGKTAPSCRPRTSRTLSVAYTGCCQPAGRAACTGLATVRERKRAATILRAPAFSPSIAARETADKRSMIIVSITAHQKHPDLVFLPAWHEEEELEAAPEDPDKDQGARR